MFKKAIIMATLAGVVLTLGKTNANAQDFIFMHKPMVDTTSSATNSMYNYVINQTDNTISVQWRLNMGITELPSGWAVSDICDNYNCYTMGLESYRTFTVGPHDTAELKPDIYAPSTGTGTVRVEVNTPNQIDTGIFILTKLEGTGIGNININDNRVSAYPNPLPAGQNLNLYVDKSLKANKAIVYNIIGQKQMVLPLASDKELNQFEVNRLPAGMYVIKINNAQGQTITARKFTKQ